MPSQAESVWRGRDAGNVATASAGIEHICHQVSSLRLSAFRTYRLGQIRDKVVVCSCALRLVTQTSILYSISHFRQRCANETRLLAFNKYNNCGFTRGFFYTITIAGSSLLNLCRKPFLH